MKKIWYVTCVVLGICLIGSGVLATMPMIAQSDLDFNLYSEIKVQEPISTTLLYEKENRLPAQLVVSDAELLKDELDSEYIKLEQQQVVTYEVDLETAGTYSILVDVKQQQDSQVFNDYIELEVNGVPYMNQDNGKVTFNDYYIYPYNEAYFSSYQKEIINTVVIPSNWQQVYLVDNERHHMKIQVELKEGKNILSFRRVSGEMLIGQVYVEQQYKLPNYKAYIESHKEAEKIEEAYFVRGEDFAYKNNMTINPAHDTALNISPNSLEIDYLNVLGKGTFNEHGDKVTYLIDVPQTGLYHFATTYKTDTGETGARKNIPVFINIYINEEIPFDSFESYNLPYTNNYITQKTQELIYLEKGINTLSIEINQSNISEVHKAFKIITDDISDIALQIKKITNGIVDHNRTWNMDEYLPNLEEDLKGYVTQINDIQDYLLGVYGNQDNEEYLNLEMSILQIERILEDIDNLPNEMNLLSEGSSSVLGKIASVMDQIITTDLSIDTLYFTGSTNQIVDMETNLIEEYQKGVKELVASFDTLEKKEADLLEVWIRRPKQNFDIIQQLVDEQFTPQTGIEVNVSMLKADDQTKLTLANAAGNAPDVITGLDGYYVADVGQRGAIEDLSTYSGVRELVGSLSRGAMMQVFVENQIYGISETQEVYVAVYRTDVFEDLGLEPAETWEDVELISSILRRNGMSIYIPLSQANSFKSYPSTAPFIIQNGGDIFAENGMETAFGAEEGIKAFQQMTDLFTIYGVELNVESVYQSFRDGDIAYAVIPASEYLRLYFSAPELTGRWALYNTPGTMQEDGTIDRTTGGSGSMVAMMESAENKESGWKFIEWWLAPETQIDYMNRLLTTYGDEYLFLASNQEVVKVLPLPEDHKTYLIEQLNYASEIQRIPGGYVVEREISNAWNKVVLDGQEVRASVEEASRLSNKEIQRKMKEFGYVNEEGVMLMPYQVNTKEDLEEWVNGNE